MSRMIRLCLGMLMAGALSLPASSLAKPAKIDNEAERQMYHSLLIDHAQQSLEVTGWTGACQRSDGSSRRNRCRATWNTPGVTWRAVGWFRYTGPLLNSDGTPSGQHWVYYRFRVAMRETSGHRSTRIWRGKDSTAPA